MKKLLVFTSTFPRWKNDTLPPHVYELSKRLTSRFEVTVLAPHYPGAKEYEVMDGIRVHRFPYFIKRYETLACTGGILPQLRKNPLRYLQLPFFLLSAYKALQERIKKDKPDIIHAHWTLPQGFLAALARKNNTPLVITAHGADIFALKWLTILKRFALRKADKITAVSESLSQSIRAIDSKLSPQIITMGVDTQIFSPKNKNDKIRRKYAIKGPFLLFVGRLEEKKGAEYIIKAMPFVLEKHSNAKLIVIGSGTQEDSLRRLAQKMRLEKSVIFTGALPNTKLPAYYATADIFISPSIIAADGDREGTPVTIMEALSSGTPVVASGLGQTEMSINIVDEKKPKLLADNISRVLRMPRPPASTLYDWQRISNEYSKLLLTLYQNHNMGRKQQPANKPNRQPAH
jgi:glycosyltransferase involved in cell wall biosynthesis